MDHVSALSRSTVFDDIPSETIEELSSLGRILSFEVDHKLFTRGEDADELLILQEGAVELFFPVEILGVTREVSMESKHEGDLLAWSALVSPYRFTLSARCASECTLTAFGREALHTFFQTDPHTGCLFMRNLAGVIGRRLHAMQMMWTRELQFSAEKRLG